MLIIIEDKKGHVLLKDRFTIVGKRVSTIVNWEDFERLEITLVDEEIDISDGTFKILKSTVIENLLYIYSSKKKKFYKEIE